jgi:hypothetical protein
MTTMGAERHSTDGDLIALLDGERGSYQRDVEAHVDSCAVCSGRLAQLQHRSARLSAALRAVEPTVRDRPLLLPLRLSSDAHRRHEVRQAVWSRSGVRAAAAVILLAGAAAASPARGWILDRVAGRSAQPAPREPNADPYSRVPTPESLAGSIVRFASESNELLIRFDVRPAAGALVIVSGDDTRCSAQIVSGARDEAFLVLPNELRIRNSTGSVADYQVVLAPTVRRARVRFGDRTDSAIATIDMTAGTRQTIELARRGGTR